jgi:hypothetical protein
MTLRYHSRHGRLCPEYVCQRKGIENAEPICQRIPGQEIDQTVSHLLLELVMLAPFLNDRIFAGFDAGTYRRFERRGTPPHRPAGVDFADRGE